MRGGGKGKRGRRKEEVMGKRMGKERRGGVGRRKGGEEGVG